MKRRELLKKLLNELELSMEDPLYIHVGTGNPDADILIIGKESSVSDKEPNEDEQYIEELVKNHSYWQRDYAKDQHDIREFKEWTDFSPLYPYKGQVYKIENGGNKGTSRTWYNYQKLINHIFQRQSNLNIDFHEYAFITEINAQPSKKTAQAKRESIPKRKDILLKSEFIQSFPIVILSGVGYFDSIKTYNEEEALWSRNEIEQMFGVDFIEQKYALNNSQPYWIHKNKSVCPQKILINTYQLSIGIADVLIEAVAEEIRTSGLYVNT